MNPRILVVDDDVAICRLLEVTLARRGFEVTSRTRPLEALQTIEEEDFDAVVTDLQMQELSGTELCRRILALRPLCPVILLTAHANFDSAVAAIRAGAYDFITKPPELDALELTVRRAVEHKALRNEVRRLRDVVSASQHLHGLVGASAAMQATFQLIQKVAASGASVLISGETGTGKELVARALHAASPRAKGPFVAFNCASMPEALVESELFGHKKGAFTNALADHTGLFAQANGGTLFLDEIGEMPLSLQPKFLRVLQERRVRPVGSDAEVPVDVRILAATHRNLSAQVEANAFREDLFFRLNVIPLEVPPLRERGPDILLLAQHFLEQYAVRSGKAVMGLSARAGEKLLAYPWPGNVRELQNCIERAVALTRSERLSLEDLPPAIRQDSPAPPVVAPADLATLAPLEEVERRYIERVLEAVGGNKQKAAKILGLDRATLYRKLQRAGLDAGKHGAGED